MLEVRLVLCEIGLQVLSLGVFDILILLIRFHYIQTHVRVERCVFDFVLEHHKVLQACEIKNLTRIVVILDDLLNIKLLNL